ncbi:hypothetical protein SETIT_5G101400v2 [Setaria italica]|uniref:Uncharacterized protein n=1 Tax=Setaria italica TaxID=4555 RepID=A0A368R3A0_SETIT|nr:hypothetical protein SETIT_5G101400v2 [Setaria italica]
MVVTADMTPATPAKKAADSARKAMAVHAVRSPSTQRAVGVLFDAAAPTASGAACSCCTGARSTGVVIFKT